MQGERHRPGKLILIAIITVAVLCVIGLIFSRHWPFAEAPVLQDLREAGDSQVRVRAFHETYFPSPGCILEGVVFDHGPTGAKPLITIEKLTIQGSYLGLLSNRVSRITADGMRVLIPAFGTGSAFHTTQSKITIGEIVANGAAVEFASKEPQTQPLRFDVHEASLQNVGWSGPLTYRLRVHNPKPPGEVTTTGKFGVWNKSNPGETPISGEYKFEQADLIVYDGIAGTLSSTGRFGGKLSHIDISGTTDTPNFEVKSGGHPMHLTTQFSAYVDATHGDTFLERVEADFWKTHIVAQGSIAKSPNGKGKTAVINLRANNARIEDLLRLFVSANRAPMSGPVTFQARVEIPPASEEFLKKVKLRGAFGIAAGTFSNPSTQEGVNKLSAGAQGQKDQPDPETALTDVSGQVELLRGTARFADLSFGVPGAAARLHGTYNLINYQIDVRGQMKVQSKISNTESGTKAFLLKAVEPFFKKKKKGEIVPVRISGTYDDPTFGLDLDDKNAQNVAPPRHKSARAMPRPSTPN
ncbi:MAG: AsmA-like C-terminal region-containing protein [Candidatus Sulfotelmatobacter sp.]